MICGIDEAGRGPVIGPMIICGALFRQEDIDTLKKIGVRDSKLLTPKRRQKLAEIIRRILTRQEIVRISPAEIDSARRKGALNELEAEKFAYIINRLKPNEVYIDSVDPNPIKFENRLSKFLKHMPEIIIVENFADRKYIAVAASSILAKVERDKEIDRLRKKYGDFGSGYPSDPKTIEFLKKWKKRYGEFPEFVRKSWKTLENL